MHIELTRAEQGCLSSEVKATGNPLIWQVDEQFQDASSFRAHQQRVAESKWGKATARCRWRTSALVAGRVRFRLSDL
ncbi:antibiotic biosynthesis monooxygenase [Arthrobacter cheniae]|uniref:Antibiotic biosynthesis monooxygenase n=1 Tax=Arthrobacter cheniae TaxID=1258888 RepID=A0A3A5M2L5_9MICC|nr:antibiotic biosynthesis monooxygenase [Arthrobacter cheniae]